MQEVNPVTLEEIAEIEASFPEIKEQAVNLSLLFNTNAINKDLPTSKFYTSSKAPILSGDAATAAKKKIQEGDADGCLDVYPVSCGTLAEKSITADYPMFINHALPKCVDKMNLIDLSAQVKDTAISYENTKVLYGINQISDRATVVDTTNLNTAKSKVTAAVRQAVSTGAVKNDIIVLISSDFSFDLIDEDFGCCDLGVQTSNPSDVVANKLNVRAIVTLPSSFPVDFEVLAYAQPLALYKDFCETPVELVTTRDLQQVTPISRIVAEDFIKVEYAEVTEDDVAPFLSAAKVEPVEVVGE